LMFNQFAAFAEYEREVIARRTKLGRYNSARKGRYMATIPAYGYVRGEDGCAEIREEQAAVIRRIFSLCNNEDLGIYAIAERLNASGIPASGKKADHWTPTAIAKILTAKRYTGSGTYGPETAIYPPIIEAETFHAAREALGRRRTAYLTGKVNGYLLAGFIRCRVCGAACTGLKTGRNRRRAYRCGGWRRGHRAGHDRGWWYADDVEDWVRGEIGRLIYRPDTLQHRVEVWLERELDELHSLKEEQERLNRELDDLPKREERVLETHSKGITTDAQQPSSSMR